MDSTNENPVTIILRRDGEVFSIDCPTYDCALDVMQQTHKAAVEMAEEGATA